jgi:hypothetical protein
MPHLVRWDVAMLKQDPGSMKSFEKTDMAERNQVKAQIEQWTEMFSSEAELRSAGAEPNVIAIANGRKFHIQWSVGEPLDGQPGYYVLKIYIFRRMN